MATPPTYVPTKNPAMEVDTTTSGNTPVAWAMFGAAGALALGKGGWIRLNGVQWKTFVARLFAAPNDGSLGSMSVEIHGANCLDQAEPNTNTKFKVLGTLNAGAPVLEVEAPYLFIRAELKTAGPAAVQVDFHGVGV